MATTYNTAFGSLPGYNEMLGTTNTTGGGQQQTYGQTTPPTTTRPPYQAAQTFAQMQRQGVARPAPPQAPQAQPFAQYGGSQQAQQMRQRLQSQLEQFGQAPSRFDTQAFQQIRGAQAANLQQEYRGQLQALNEEMARRGLSASSVGGGRMGDLAGQQARALATLDAQLLQQAAETQAQDRAQLLAASQGLAELASAQDLAQFEANRVAQAATFENQLRAAQFGQQQFEQAGQEAFQGAQAEEAARQAERQFGLQATGQAATLSMDLQRLLGQQEIERAGLTGQLGGMQTLAGRQFGEQQRQFDIQQALQAQLGLGGLSLEQQRFAEQARQFGVTSAEEQRQFNIQQALQQQLGLGGLGLQQAQFGLEQQRFVQQAQDAAAERELRQILQTRELTAQERQQLTDIQSRRELQTQQLGVQQAESAAERDIRLRLQSGQITAEQAQQERQIAAQQALQTQQLGQQQQQFVAQLQQQAQDNAAERQLREKLQTTELSAQERQQLTEIQARKDLQTQQIGEQARQFGLTLSDQQAARVYQGGFTTQELAIRRQQVDNELALQNRQLSETERNNLAIRGLQRDQFESEKDFRSQQLGLNRDELEQRANQIKEDQRLRGVEIDDQRAYRDAEIDLRTTQISNEYNIAGRQIDEQEARRLAEQDINDADNTAQMERLKAQIASQEKVSGADRAVQQRQLIFQNAARLSEQSGVQYTVDADGEIVPLRDAQGNPVRTSAFTQAAEARKLQQEELTLRRQLGVMEATGQGLTVDTEGRLVPATGTGAQTLQARQLAFQNAARLSEQSGVQYTVKDDGTVDVLRDAQGNPVRTSAFTQADETRKQQETLTKLDINLRRQLGLTEATGQMYNIDPNTGVATTVAGGAQTVESRRVAAQERQMAIQSAMQLSEQSGIQHEVKTDGTVGPMRDASGQPMRTSALTQASLDRALREQLGLMEATGQVYTRDAAGTVSLATGAQAARTIQAQQLAFQRAAQLSEQSGIQHEVKADGTVAPLIVNNQPVRTSAESRFNLDLQFRRQMGLMEQTGQAFNIDAATGRATLATGAEALSTLGRLQQNLQNAQIMSQITGRQYTVNERGELVTTSTADTEARRQFDLETQLRRQLGLTEASGYIYEIGKDGLSRTTQETVQGQIARSQTLLALANALGNLTPEQISQLLGRPSGTNPPVTTRAPGTTDPPLTSTPPITGETTTSPPTTTQAPYSGWNPEVDMFGYVNQASLLQTPLKSIIESGTDLNSIIGTRYKVGGYYVFYDGSGWKAIPAAG